MPGATVGGPTTSRTRSQDAGRSTNEEDAGTVDAGAVDAGVAVSVCMRLNGAFTDGTAVVTAVEAPADFAVTRQQELWSTACTNPRLTLEFSDGYCPNGRGHNLSFSFGYRELIDGTLHSGNNAVRSETESPELVVRYERPSRLSPTGVWGTCEGASGTLVFYGEPTPMIGASLQARFTLTLTACDGSGAAPQIVEGAFNLVLFSSVARACPDSTF